MQNKLTFQKKKVVAIIPAYNESEHIEEVIVNTKQFVDMVIVVDDGSKDNTYDLAVNAGADIVASHPLNSGKGVALYTGFEIAEEIGADIIITIDADGQHDAKEIPRFVSKMLDQSYDIVIGSRQRSSNMPIVFRFGNFVLNTTFALLYGQKISDTQSGYRAFTKGIFSKIKWESSGYVVETEILAHARRSGLKLGEITIANTYHNKYKGTTVFDGMRIFIRMLSWRIF